MAASTEAVLYAKDKDDEWKRNATFEYALGYEIQYLERVKRAIDLHLGSRRAMVKEQVEKRNKEWGGSADKRQLIATASEADAQLRSAEADPAQARQRFREALRAAHAAGASYTRLGDLVGLMRQRVGHRVAGG